MAEDRIDSIIDLGATQKEVDALELQIKKVVELIKSTKEKSVEVTTAKSVTEYSKLSKELGGLIDQSDAAAKASTLLAEAGKKTAGGMKFQIQSFKEFGSTLTDSIQKQLALKNRLDEIKESLKKLNEFEEAGKKSKEFADEVVRLTTEQAHLQNELTETNRLVKLQVKEMNSEEETLKQARAANLLLIKQRDETNVKTEEGRKKIAELNLEIDKNNDLIKENSSTLEKVKINIGNYAGSLAGAFDKVIEEIQKVKNKNEELKSSFQNLSGGRTTIQGFKAGATGFDSKTTAQLKLLTAEIDRNDKALLHLNETQALGFRVTGNHTQQVKNLENAYISLATSGTVSNEFLQEFRQSIGSVKDDVNDLRQSIKLAASDTQGLDVLIGTAQAIAGGFALVQGAAALAGDENEDLQKTLVKLNAIMTILNGLQAIQAELKKKDNIVTIAQIGLQKLYTFVVGTSTGALKVFKIALASTGVGLLVIGIGFLISKLMEFTDSTDFAAEAQERFNIKLEKQKELLEDTITAIDNDTKILINLAKQRGAAEDEVNKITLDGIRKRKNEVGSELTTQKLQLGIVEATVAALGGEKNATESLIEEKKALTQTVRDLNKEYDALQIDEQTKFTDKLVDDAKKLTDANKTSLEERKKASEAAAAKQKELAQRNARAIFEIEKLEIESRLRFYEKSINDQKELDVVRLDSLQQYIYDKINLIEKEFEFEKTKRDLTAKEILLLEKQRQEKLNQLYTEAAEIRNNIVSDELDEELSLRENAAKRIESAIKEGVQKANDAIRELVQQRRELKKELGEELGGLAFDLLTAQYEKEKNLIQDQIDLLERKKQKDIEVANATITNAQDRAAAITIINARAQSEEDILEQKKRQVNIKEAQFEKAESIANIISKTAEAIIATLAKTPPPAGLPLAFLIGAIGAAQLARVIATPIPKYGEGTESHKGGLAVVGDAGKSEGIKLPDGTVMKTPATSTIVDLPKGTKVYPDFNKMMLKATLTDVPVFKETTRSDKTEAAVLKMEKSVVSAIKKIPQSVTTAENIISRKIRSTTQILRSN